MDQTLAQIINDLIAANQEIVRLRQENEQRANPVPKAEANGHESHSDPTDRPSAALSREGAVKDSA